MRQMHIEFSKKISKHFSKVAEPTTYSLAMQEHSGDSRNT
jgi:hypothetical protein